jgi:hypothetical protein
MLSPDTTAACRNRAACGVSEPSSTSSSRRAARTTNLRMLTAENPREMPLSTTCTRCPAGSVASTNGRLTSTRRPLAFSSRSTSSSTCSAVRIVVVSSCRPSRATNTRDGSLIQISSTPGSSRYSCSGPNPATRASSSSSIADWSATGSTAPERLVRSCSPTTSSAMRRTAARSTSGSTPWRRTASRSRVSRSSTVVRPLAADSTGTPQAREKRRGRGESAPRSHPVTSLRRQSVEKPSPTGSREAFETWAARTGRLSRAGVGRWRTPHPRGQ